MLARLALLFVLIFLAELVLLIKVGGFIGTFPTVLIVAVTGVGGAALARTQGVRLMARIRNEVAAGRMPEEGLLDGLFVLAGGVLMLTPGLITDAAGLFLLSPAGRRLCRGWLRRRATSWVEEGTIRIFRR